MRSGSTGKRRGARPVRPPKAPKSSTAKRTTAQRAGGGDPFARLFEASPAGLLITRASNGEILEINDAFCRLLGYPRAELIGATLRERGLQTDGDDREFVLRTLRRDGAVRNLERRFRRRSGEERIALVAVHPILFRDDDCLLSTALDVTESTRAAAALAQSDETFRAMFRSLPVAVMHGRLIFEGDRPADFEILRVNPAFYAISGLVEVEGRRVTDIVNRNAADFQEWLDLLARIVRTGSPERFEVYADDRDAWYANTVYSPALGEFVVVSEDVTQRKRAERALLNGKAKLEAALNAMTDAVFISDANGRFVEFNDAFVTFHRFRNREECRKTFAEYPEFLDVYADDGSLAPVEMWAVPRALRGEVGSNVEYRLHRRDSGETWRASYTFAPIRDASGAVIGSVVTGRDITGQKRIAEELLKLSLVVEQNPQSVMITDPHGRIEYVNEALVRKSGYTRGELLGQNPRLFASGRTSPETYDGLRGALAEGRVYKCEFNNRRKDGGGYVDLAVIHPIRSTDGTITHFVSVADDITERKRIDAELDLHRHHLEAMVRDRTAELAVATGIAEAAARAKSAFLANMSHEIRTPLNAVLGLAQLGYRDTADEKVRISFRRILESGRLLLAAVNDVLDLSKLEASKIDVESVPVAISSVVDEAISAMSPAAAAKNLRLACELTPDLPEAFLGDRVRIGQILLNLISNAVKFTERGEVRLRVRRDGDRIEFGVSDTGIGIRAEDLPRLFEPFEQAEPGTTRRFGGTGLGLAISRRLAELMGGELSAISTVGAGSTFALRLPLVAARATRAGAASPTGTAVRRLAGLRILAAEDNALNRIVLEEALSGEGAQVVSAENGRRAVEVFASADSGGFDLVLMDVQMPELDGLEATRQIRGLDPGIPIVGQTAHAHATEHEACHDAGMVDVITKPVDFDLLVDTIRRRARRTAGNG